MMATSPTTHAAPKEDLSKPVQTADTKADVKADTAPDTRDPIVTPFDVPPIPPTVAGQYEVVAYSLEHFEMLKAYPNVTTYAYDECNVIAPPATIVFP
jgi:hypothetical protein